MKNFLEAIEQNEELKAKIETLNANPQAKTEDFIALAGEYGFTLTAEDFAPVEAKVNTELSDDELESVAGGGNCACFLGGGGTATKERELTCACVGCGGGEFYEYDDPEKKSARCVCVVYGEGY